MPESARLFTLEEATALMPQVRDLMLNMQKYKLEAEVARQEISRLNEVNLRGNGYDMKREQLSTKIATNYQKVQAGLDKLNQLGVQVKDIDTGLVDFPAAREGRVINLCWKTDEPAIGWWHEVYTGFASRRPL